MLGYWLGAILVGVTLGPVIVYELEGSSVINTTKKTLSPIANFVLAALMFVLAAVLATGRDKGLEERRKRRKAKRGPGLSAGRSLGDGLVGLVGVQGLFVLVAAGV